MSDPIGDAESGGDAFAGGGTAPLNSEGSLPGFGMNDAVPGAYASPVGDNPSVFHGDALEMQANESSGTSGFSLGGTTDGFATAMSPTSMAGFSSANTGLGAGMLSNTRSAIASAGGGGGAQGPPSLGPQGQDPQQPGGQQMGPAPAGAGGAAPPDPPPPAVIGGSGGFLTAQVQHADDNLISMLQSAASGSGGVNTLFAPTVALASGGVSAGGSVQGQHNSLGPYTIYKDPSWFGDTINAWQQIPPPPPDGQPPPGGPGDAGGGGPAGPGGPGAPGGPAQGGAQPDPVQQALDKSMTGFGAGGATGDSGDALIPASAYPSQAEQDYGNKFNDSVWSDLGPGISTVGQDEAAGGKNEGPWDNLGGITTVAQDNASGVNTPGPGFGSLGGSEGGSMQGNTAFVPATGFYSRGYDPLGSNLVQPGDLYSAHPSFGARLYSG